MNGWLAFGSLVVAVIMGAAIFWFRHQAKKARELATRKEAERAREQSEHNATLKTMRKNADEFIASSERKKEVLDNVEGRLLEVRRARVRALSGDDLLDAANRLWGKDQDGVR